MKLIFRIKEANLETNKMENSCVLHIYFTNLRSDYELFYKNASNIRMNKLKIDCF
jgi:hypothetical protein